MAYYRAGGYYRAGDYYRGGSIFSAITGAVRGFVTGGPLGAIRGAVSGLSPSRPTLSAGLTSPAGLAPSLTAAARPGRHKEPGVTGLAHRLVPGGKSGYLKNRRTMHYTNPKALKRAERRLRGFEKMAKRALRPLGLHVVRHTCQHSSHKFGRKRA